MLFGCLTAIIVFVFSIVLTFVILVFTGVSITVGLFFRLLAKILVPLILIGLGISLITKNRN